MEHRLNFVSHGARLGVRVDDPGAFEDVQRALPPGSQLQDSGPVDALYSLSRAPCGPAGAAHHRLHRGPELLQTAASWPQLIQRLESELHFSVASHARARVFVHAGVVGWKGRALVLPGRSRTGKTSLVAALVRAGAEYYSDEYAVFDAEGRVLPYPKSLGMRQSDGTVERLAPRRLGGDVGTRPLPLGLVLSTRYRAGASFEPREQGLGSAVLCLIDNTLMVRAKPRLALDTLAAAVEGAQMAAGERGEAEDAAAVLLAGAA